MSELKAVHAFDVYEAYTKTGDDDAAQVYLKSEADKVIAELKNRIAPKQSDKTLQERLNEVCKKHAVSTLQDLDWSLCMVEARLEDYTKLAADKHEALEKMLQYKVLYKELCRDINTQERFFAMKVSHANYKRCLAMAKVCKLKRIDAADYRIPREKWEFYEKWHNRWLAIAEKFKPNSTINRKEATNAL